MPRSRVGRILLCLLLVASAGGSAGTGPQWGFFGHRRINQLAVYTLPPEMAPLFRAHVDYLTEHAVDPDKRRYASTYEAVRHYMDLDHWGRPPFPTLPRDYARARLRHGELLDVRAPGDTVAWSYDTLFANTLLLRSAAQTTDVDPYAYRRLWYGHAEAPPVDSVRATGLPVGGEQVLLRDSLTAHGILPYHLQDHHRRLTRAFVAGDADRVLQLAAELGHYVGDAHVPLHTTENYNGQLTGQTGIHAFWESRLPELFADAGYDYLVGPADYIADPQDYYWNIVLESHALVDSVLHTEARLRAEYPVDRQRCFEDRLGKPAVLPCAEYAAAWSDAMNGMVEERFRAAIHAVGSAWYSCWVDAGQPDLTELTPLVMPVTDTLSSAAAAAPESARPHE